MVNEKGGKGGDPYVQRRGMKTRMKGRISETGKVKTIA
jgi:hypothetical protein